jgi:hypothetical protein
MPQQVFGLSQSDVLILKRLAATVDDLEKLIAVFRGDETETPNAPDMYMAYVDATALPAATGTVPDLTPGSLALPIYRRNRTTGVLTKLTHPNSNDKEETVYNASEQDSCTTTFIPVQRDKFGDWWWLLGSAGEMKPLVRFTLGADLTTSDESKTATITDQFGPGMDNSTSITVYNHKVTPALGTAPEYMFSGDSGDAGLAIWDSGTNYRIIQIQCP